MSVLIQGMDMPKACEWCQFISTFSTEHGLGCRCEILNSEFWDYTKRQDNCPLREIPTPHGRLINADMAIKEIAKAFLDKPWGGMDFGLKVEEIIDNIPEIIEADKLPVEERFKACQQELIDIAKQSEAPSKILKIVGDLFTSLAKCFEQVELESESKNE